MIIKYARKPQEALQQFIEACKAELTHTKILKALWIIKAKAQREGKACQWCKVLLLKLLQPGQTKPANVEMITLWMLPEIEHCLRNQPLQRIEAIVMETQVREHEVVEEKRAT
ncbi:hypothetical protein PR048_016517 [Dryococelus australis]|uniref:Uncharacterized protein n=1 Tax=Dryococelus australis TaxID=614101 RepID=A0ABQ9HJY9_9NEOP|nr:hypothetical protein PR048_016517 [Dryococelus australis]